MKYQEIADLCNELHTQFDAEPWELFLTPDSRAELTDDVISKQYLGGVSANDIGIVVDVVENPVTLSEIDICDAELDYDTAIVELRLS